MSTNNNVKEQALAVYSKMSNLWKDMEHTKERLYFVMKTEDADEMAAKLWEMQEQIMALKEKFVEVTGLDD